MQNTDAINRWNKKSTTVTVNGEKENDVHNTLI